MRRNRLSYAKVLTLKGLRDLSKLRSRATVECRARMLAVPSHVGMES